MSSKSGRKDPVVGHTPGWPEDSGLSQKEIIDNLHSPLGDASPDALDEKALNLLVKVVGVGYAKNEGLWDRLDLNIGWILQILKDENPELATKLADDFERFSDTLWGEVLQYRWPPMLYRYGLPEAGAEPEGERKLVA